MEFLLFNVKDAADHIQKVLVDWESVYGPAISRRRLIRSYFRIGRFGVRHAYILVRLARRAMMKILPPVFFFRSGMQAGNAELTPAQFGELQRRIGTRSAILAGTIH